MVDRITQARASAVYFSPRWLAAVNAVADVDSLPWPWLWCLCDRVRLSGRRTFAARFAFGRPRTATGTSETSLDRLPVVNHGQFRS